MSKNFSVRSNAIRNARSQLGKTAQQGVHFTVSGDKASGFTWAPVPDAPAVPEVVAEANAVEQAPVAARVVKRKQAKARSKAKLPKAVKKYLGKRVNGADDVAGKRRVLINMITGKHGASLEAICKRLGWQKHTVRGAISTANSQGIISHLDSYRSERGGQRIYKAVKVKAAA